MKQLAYELCNKRFANWVFMIEVQLGYALSHSQYENSLRSFRPHVLFIGTYSHYMGTYWDCSGMWKFILELSSNKEQVLKGRSHDITVFPGRRTAMRVLAFT